MVRGHSLYESPLWFAEIALCFKTFWPQGCSHELERDRRVFSSCWIGVLCVGRWRRLVTVSRFSVSLQIFVSYWTILSKVFKSWNLPLWFQIFLFLFQFSQFVLCESSLCDMNVTFLYLSHPSLSLLILLAVMTVMSDNIILNPLFFSFSVHNLSFFILLPSISSLLIFKMYHLWAERIFFIQSEYFFPLIEAYHLFKFNVITLFLYLSPFLFLFFLYCWLVVWLSVFNILICIISLFCCSCGGYLKIRTLLLDLLSLL